mgnify:FL=1
MRQLQRNVDAETAGEDAGRRDEPIISLLGCQLLKCDAAANDPDYRDPSYNSQYIAPNQQAYDRGGAQAGTGLTPQEITDRNNAAGARLAQAGVVALGGYVLAPALAGVAAEVAAFVKNPVGYCLSNQAACTVAAEAVGYTVGGVPQPGSVALPKAGAALGAKSVGTKAEQIFNAERIGSGLKADVLHRAASFLSKEQLQAGQVFPLRGGDGVERILLQTPGDLNGKNGIYEYIYDPVGKVTHQRFIEGGTVTGFPNQRVSKVP